MRISTRSIVERGNTLRSKAETSPRTPAGPMRRPFRSTRVRFAPRPRSEMVCAPRPPLCTNANEVAAVTCGEPAATVFVCNSSPTDAMPAMDACSTSMTAIGAELVKTSLRMREPVTTTSSIGRSSSASSSCAKTCGAIPSALAARATLTALANGVFLCMTASLDSTVVIVCLFLLPVSYRSAAVILQP